MSTDTQQVVSKAWNFAHVLRDDGLSYMAYVEQITFLLFLKMADLDELVEMTPTFGWNVTNSQMQEAGEFLKSLRLVKSEETL